ncbi:hypothetical protein LCGC14_2245200 [marine sediment metagenome]|uniref:Uncharacterized protein n=1 Tax=marine sediment metagenome TaxID=412755 RepID=A0A0F9FGT5_9ZZZZ
MEIKILGDKKGFKRGFKQLLIVHDVENWKAFMEKYNPESEVICIKIYLKMEGKIKMAKNFKLSERESIDLVWREIMMEDKENFTDSFRAKVLMAIQAIREVA